MTQPTSSSPLHAMRRADAMVVGGAFLVLVFSFLPQLHVSEGRFGSESSTMWHPIGLVEVFAVPLVALAVAAFAALHVLQPDRRETPLLVATPAQWRDVLSLVPAIASVFALILWHKAGGIGYGAYLVFLFAVVVAVGAIGAGFVPALGEPLTSSSPAAPSAPTEEAGQPPEAVLDPPAPEAPEAWSAPEPPATELPDQTVAAPPTTYAVSSPQEPHDLAAQEPPAEAAVEPVPEPAFEPVALPEPAWEPVAEPAFEPVAEPEPVAGAAPFWACFPTVRPLVDASDQPVAQVTPEEWYLVLSVEGHGATVQTTDGRQGLLTDLTGMVRADA